MAGGILSHEYHVHEYSMKDMPGYLIGQRLYNGVIGGEGGLPSVIPHLDVKNGEIVYCSDRHTYSTYLEDIL